MRPRWFFGLAAFLVAMGVVNTITGFDWVSAGCFFVAGCLFASGLEEALNPMAKWKP